MGEIHFGINLEFVRHDGKPFEWGVEKAAQLGFTHVEPMVHWGRELLSEAGYFHSVSMLGDPLRVRDAAERNGLSISALSSHSPLCRPDVSGDYLRQAVRFASECGAPVIVTDDRSEEHTSELQSRENLVCRLLLEKKKKLQDRLAFQKKNNRIMKNE